MMAPSSLSKKLVMTPMTDQELDSVTIVFHQFETGLREGTIYTKVRRGRPLSFMLSHGEMKILNVILLAKSGLTDLYLLHIYFLQKRNLI